MEMPILAHSEQVAEAALGGFEDRVFDGVEFGVDVLSVLAGAREGGEDFNGFVFFAFENEPARAFRE